jgi:hypothetical protein
MALDLSDDERFALVRLLTRTIEDDRYPLSPRIRTLRGILAKLDPPPAVTSKPVSSNTAQRSPPRGCAGSEAATQQVKSEPGPPMTLGGAAAAGVWCPRMRSSGRALARRAPRQYGARSTVLECRERLVCCRCGSRHVDMVVSGTERR